MSKKARKEAQRLAFEKAQEEKKQKLLNPDLSDNEMVHFRNTCERYFKAYRAVSKPGYIAKFPRFGNEIAKSHFGGEFLMLPTDEWPISNGQPMSAVLEVHLNEISNLPEPLQGFDLVQVFLVLEEEGEWPVFRDKGFYVRTLMYDEKLIPRSEGLKVAETAINWEFVAHDIPVYPDDLDLIDDELSDEFTALPNWSALKANQFPCGLFTRIGGWPKWVQNGGSVGEFCIQLEGESAGVDMGFDGSVYFGYDNGWKSFWEIG